ncbi:hypothetical protein MtrunA17_Chr6g0463111 [Medicago truncatula]|uniref:DUF3143 family protein n=1 Tax=Medicago truncatula TaxID=3880 RepID=A0A072U8R2_MEDTR|nr:uncharacterized protein LOC25496022 [Medicago truncatula]KEH25771.1 DUF3143 family protein [Medicago truncatula]RHN50950.1 hypothetical protein MtrunA17_Chr6g0463111 [Medicago truncatula]
MSAITTLTFTNTTNITFPTSISTKNPIFHTTHFTKPLHLQNPLSISLRKPISTIVLCKGSVESESEVPFVPEDEWLQKLPEKTKPLYTHSLPCIEAWLKSLGFNQSKDDRALWVVNKSDWCAQLSLDVTDLYVRYLKSGPGNLEKDVERRFSYALSREDIENAVLGGP